MTNMPGSGNGGYGGGWTPPTPGQLPAADGQRNAYGQPIAQPLQAPGGNYPPRQPGTNAYGQPIAPQQPQVPPTVPPQPGSNGYGQPLAAQQPVAPPPGYGPPPGTNGYGQPPAPAKNRKPLLIAFAIVVVVAIVGAAGWTFMNTGSSSGPDSAATAGDAVKGYLEALSRGDASGALAFSNDQPASKDFLTDDILKQQIAKWPITNIRILSDSSASGGNSAISFGQVHVAVNFGDKSSDTNISVKKQDSHWRLDRAAVKLEANGSGIGNQAAANTLTLFGKPLNGNAAYVFPGFLDIASSNQNITVTTKNPVLLDQLATGGSSASLQPTYTVTDAAKTAIMAQVKAITDACTNSHAAVPPKPCDAVAFGVVDGTVNWGPADLSRIKIDNVDNYSSAGLTVRVSGQAFFNNVTGTDQWNGGGTKTLAQQSMYINGSVDLTRSPLTLSQK
ncbi:hypothetical protein GCM10009856_07180 [Mycolicibacterium llatzerense]